MRACGQAGIKEGSSVKEGTADTMDCRQAAWWGRHGVICCSATVVEAPTAILPTTRTGAWEGTARLRVAPGPTFLVAGARVAVGVARGAMRAAWGACRQARASRWQGHQALLAVVQLGVTSDGTSTHRLGVADAVVDASRARQGGRHGRRASGRGGGAPWRVDGPLATAFGSARERQFVPTRHTARDLTGMAHGRVARSSEAGAESTACRHQHASYHTCGMADLPPACCHGRWHLWHVYE